MKIVKYYKDNCPGCDQLSDYCKKEGYVFDEEIDAVKDLSTIERRQLAIKAAPTVIIFKANGEEMCRFTGPDMTKTEIFFSKRNS